MARLSLCTLALLVALAIPLRAQIGHSLSALAGPFPSQKDAAMPLPRVKTKPRHQQTGHAGLQSAPFTSSQAFLRSPLSVFPSPYLPIYSPVGKVRVDWPDGTVNTCSGAIIEPRILLTAAHCVHRGVGGADGFVVRLVFAPTYFLGDAREFWFASGVFVHPAWIAGRGILPNAGDYALVELADNELGRVGDVTGTYRVGINRLFPNHVTMLGYPSAFDGGEFLHVVSSQSFQKGRKGTVLYGGDMTDGADGGPWIENFGYISPGQHIEGRSRQVVGVLSYSYLDERGNLLLGSSALNESFLDLRELACANQEGNCAEDDE